MFGKNAELCAAFLMNQDKIYSTVHFLNSSYTLSPNSISILPDCKNVDFNTAKVSSYIKTIVSCSFLVMHSLIFSDVDRLMRNTPREQGNQDKNCLLLTCGRNTQKLSRASVRRQ